MKRYFYIILFALIFIVSCRKPPEDKLAGKWKIEAAFVNGTDKTSELDTLYILYYEFTGWESNNSKNDVKPNVALILDQSKAQWDDSCSYYWVNQTYSIDDDKTEITF